MSLILCYSKAVAILFIAYSVHVDTVFTTEKVLFSAINLFMNNKNI